MQSSHFSTLMKWTVVTSALLALVNIAQAQQMSPEYAAAMCIAKNKDCTPEIANQTSSCEPDTYVKAQNQNCLLAACIFCRRVSNQGLSICHSSWAITNWCPEISLPSITPTPSSSVSPGSPSILTSPSPTAGLTFSPSVSHSLLPSSPASDMSPSPAQTEELDPSFSPEETPIISSSPNQKYSPDLAAAMCIAKAETCDSEISKDTKFCQPKTFVKEQHSNCLKAACLYCRRDSNVGNGVCNAWSIRHWCPKITLESMTPSGSPSHSPSHTAHSVAKNPSSSPSVAVAASPSTANSPSSTPLTTASSPLTEYKGPDHAAAVCFAKGKDCTLETANESDVCKPNKFSKQQTDLCLKKACHFCSLQQNQNINECKSWAITNWCKKAPSKSSVPTSSPKISKSLPPYPPCVYSEKDGQVAISMSNMKPQGHWSKTDNGKAVVWRQGNNRTSVDSWKSTASSQYCFNVLIQKAGTYYITAHTSAPHWSEHNDMWLRCSAGIDLYDAKTHKKRNTKMSKSRFFKAYQNFGNNRIADIISSVNFDPHIFVTSPVKSNTIIELCVAGRSSKFRVYDLVMIHCVGENCKRSSNHIRETMRSLKYTSCRGDFL